MSIVRVAGLFLLFCLSLSAGSRLFDSGLPAPPFIRSKLEHLEKNRDHYDVLFIGSSRVYRGVVPNVFDSTMKRLGHATWSFNLAMLAMRPHEANAYLRDVLARQPSRISWVLIELADWTPVIVPSNRFTERAIHWHDPLESLSVLRSSILLQAPLVDRLRTLIDHLLHWGAHATNLGRGPKFLRTSLATAEPSAAEGVLARRGFDPFTPAEYKGGLTGARRREFLASLDQYRDDLGRLAATNEAPASLAHYNVTALVAQAEFIRRAGAEPIYLIPPTADPTPELFKLHQEGAIESLLAFNDPVAYPELYRVDHRFDRRHLNTAGARAFSVLLAHRFAEWLAQH